MAGESSFESVSSIGAPIASDAGAARFEVTSDGSSGARLGATAPPHPFTFTSRWVGRILMGFQVLFGLIGLMGLPFIALGMGAPDAYAGVKILHTLVVLASLAVYFLSSLAYLIWLPTVHRDLRERSAGAYPVSPLGALARISIPLINLWGTWDVFDKLSDELSISLSRWVVLLYVFTLGSNVAARAANPTTSMANPSWLIYSLAAVAQAVVWFGITHRVHNALTGLEAAARPPIEAAVATAADSAERSPGTLDPTSPLGMEPEAVTSAPKRMGMGRRLKIALVVAALMACGIFALGVIVVPRIFGTLTTWYDDEFFEVAQILFEHMGATGVITNGDVQMGFISGGSSGQTEVRMLINVETIEHCAAAPFNPCEALADDLARLALRHYGRIDELGGLDVTLTTVDEAGEAILNSGLEKWLTIDEWRAELDSSDA